MFFASKFTSESAGEKKRDVSRVRGRRYGEDVRFCFAAKSTRQHACFQGINKAFLFLLLKLKGDKKTFMHVCRKERLRNAGNLANTKV